MAQESQVIGWCQFDGLDCLHRELQEKRREIKKELSNAPNVSWLQTRESKIRYMHTSMHRFA